MSHPAKETIYARTRAIAEITLDLSQGAAIGPREAGRRLGLGTATQGRYMPALWDAVPAPSFQVNLSGLTPTELAVVQFLANECGRFKMPADICVGAKGHAVAFAPHVRAQICGLRMKGVPIRTWTKRGYALDGRAARAKGMIASVEAGKALGLK